MYGKRFLAERYTKVLLLSCPIPLVPLIWVPRVPGLVKACAYFTGKALGFTYEKVSKTATSIVVTTTVHTLGLQHFSNLTKYLPWSKIEIPLLVT